MVGEDELAAEEEVEMVVVDDPTALGGGGSDPVVADPHTGDDPGTTKRDEDRTALEETYAVDQSVSKARGASTEESMPMDVDPVGLGVGAGLREGFAVAEIGGLDVMVEEGATERELAGAPGLSTSHPEALGASLVIQVPVAGIEARGGVSIHVMMVTELVGHESDVEEVQADPEEVRRAKKGKKVAEDDAVVDSFGKESRSVVFGGSV